MKQYFRKDSVSYGKFGPTTQNESNSVLEIIYLEINKMVFKYISLQKVVFFNLRAM